MDFSTKTIADPPKEEAVSANETTVDSKDGTGKLGDEAPKEDENDVAPADEPISDATLSRQKSSSVQYPCRSSNEEKGIAFIVRCSDASEIFGHKREFADGVELRVGQLVSFNEEKGTAFIVRCSDASEIFGHKREFADGVELRVGQPVSFVYEVTEKGGTAKKVLVTYSKLDLG